MNSSSGRVALVTGASSGIGEACARHLGGRGFRVFGTSRRASSDAAADGGMEMLSMDVDSDASVETAVATLGPAFERFAAAGKSVVPRPPLRAHRDAAVRPGMRNYGVTVERRGFTGRTYA